MDYTPDWLSNADAHAIDTEAVRRGLRGEVARNFYRVLVREDGTTYTEAV